jgi:hypothetical protein
MALVMLMFSGGVTFSPFLSAFNYGDVGTSASRNSLIYMFLISEDTVTLLITLIYSRYPIPLLKHNLLRGYTVSYRR